MKLLPGVRSATVDTDRIRMHLLESGPADGPTVVMVHGNYPGDATATENWPGTAPGTTGILNALSPKYCDWSSLVDLDPKPPVLWTHGDADLVVADGSPLEMGTLGAAGAVPGWPGADVFPPQPMVSQIREVLERYAAAGGAVRTEMFPGSGHGPHSTPVTRGSRC